MVLGYSSHSSLPNVAGTMSVAQSVLSPISQGSLNTGAVLCEGGLGHVFLSSLLLGRGDMLKPMGGS